LFLEITSSLIFIWKGLRPQLSIGTVADIQLDGVFQRLKVLKDRKELTRVRKETLDLKVRREAKAGREFKVVKGAKVGRAIRDCRESKDLKDAKVGRVGKVGREFREFKDDKAGKEQERRAIRDGREIRAR
jgi:hypothetical protein